MTDDEKAIRDSMRSNLLSGIAIGISIATTVFNLAYLIMRAAP